MNFILVLDPIDLEDIIQKIQNIPKYDVDKNIQDDPK
jgi:hypothetical protein